jgi:hypothetical protein
MTAAQFSKHLQRLAVEFSLGNAADMNCPPRGNRHVVPHADPLYDLIANYDTSTFASGGIDLHVNPRPYSGKYEVGTSHGDLLVVDPVSGNVQFVEYGTDHVPTPVAATTATFLDALAVAAEYYARCLVDERLYEDQLAKRQYAKRCAEAAGGAVYEPLYFSSLGCE